MKKKKTTLSVLTIIFLGVFLIHYTRPIISQEKMPNLAWSVTKGDAASFEGMHLNGFVIEEGVWRSVIIDEDGSTYPENALFQSSYTEQHPIIKNYQQRYPAFMRGKERFPSNYTETGTHLFYVDDYYDYEIENDSEYTLALPVAILNKETGEEREEEITIQGTSPVNFAYVEELLATEKFLVFEFVLSQSDKQSTLIYVYDWRKSEVVAEFVKAEMIAGIYYGGNLDIFVLDEENDQLLAIETIETYPDDFDFEHDFTPPEITRTFYIYDVQTGEQNEIVLPEDFNKTEGQFYAQNGKIYLIDYQDDAFHVSAYDVEQQELIQNEVPAGKAFEDGGLYVSLQSNEGNLLLAEHSLQNKESQIGFLLLDLETLSAIAEGQIETEADVEIYIQNIYFE